MGFGQGVPKLSNSYSQIVVRAPHHYLLTGKGVGRIELDDLAINMPLDSEIIPAIARSSKAIETRLDISLSEGWQELWQKFNRK